MTLIVGSKLGPYEIVAPIGAGGMGEVYRARDARLDREVAVKVLPATFAHDADRLRRFEQEARATSALNHPNILSIHDLGSDGGVPYVVFELLDGETLRERIGGTALPVRKAIELAAQIAKGLAAAHDKGIVHRDLKPDNVFVTRDGRAKILDFGLAKLVGTDLLTESPTATGGPGRGTDAGQVLGTVGYMSPEQVRARPVDHRSDIFSFGAVLYEMLAGQRAFRGASAVETLNAILKEDPPALGSMNRQLPPALERIVSHCLEKSPEERFQSARDVAFDLEQLTDATQVGQAIASDGRSWRRPLWFGLGAGAVALAGIAFVAGGRLNRPPLVSYQPLTFRRGNVASARFAGDGRTVIYGARWETEKLEIFSTEPGRPESRSLGIRGVFLQSVSSTGELALRPAGPLGTGATLSRVPVGGGSPRDVLDDVVAADWSPDGSSLAVVVRPPGQTARLEYPIGTSLFTAPSEMTWPRVSRHGDAVAFCEHPVLNDNRGGIAMVDRAGKHAMLADGFADIGGVAWSPDDREIWFTAARSGAERQLYAVTREGRLREVVQVPGNIGLEDINAKGDLILNQGQRRPVVVALEPGASGEKELSWLDYSVLADISRDGHLVLFSEEGVGGGPGYAVYLRKSDGSPAVRLGRGLALSLAPDGKQALCLDLGTGQLVVLPTGAGAPLALPRGTLAAIHGAAFLPDGRHIGVFGNESGKPPRAWIQDLGGGPPRPLFPDGVIPIGPHAVTPDSAWKVAQGPEGPPLFYPLAGGEPRALPGIEGGDEVLQVGDDGTSLFVRLRGPGRAVVVRVDLRSGRREPWKTIGPTDLAGVALVSHVELTSDGKGYAYSYVRQLSTLYEVTGLR